MRSQYKESDADARLIKMVAAIVLLAVVFWMYKHYLLAQVAPTVAAAAGPPLATPQLEAPRPELWGNTDGDPVPAEDAAATQTPTDDTPPQLTPEQRLQVEQARLAQALAASNPQPGSAVLQPSAAQIQNLQCQAAKDHREAVLKQVGLNRTFDLLRQLDEQVYEACKTK